MKKEDFYTTPKANAGVKMPLKNAEGNDSGQWLIVRGTDSDAFRKARFDGARTLRDTAKGLDEWDRAKLTDKVVMANLVSLVAGWSFDEPCTPEAVTEFLTSAPQIADAVDANAAERAHFFGPASESSKSTRKRS